MAILTLAQAKERINDEIGRGIIQTVVNFDPMYSFLPFTPFSGQSLTVNPVAAYGDAQVIGVGDSITASNPATYDRKTFYPTTFVGEVEMNGLVQATSLGAGVDELEAQLQLKSRVVAEKFQSAIATATGTAPQIESLRSLATAGQTINGNGANLSYVLLDELKDKVRSKGRSIDAFVMPLKAIRIVKQLMREAGGNTSRIINGITVEEFEGVPMIPNDYLSQAENAAGVESAGAVLTSIYAVNFDDGTKTTGVSAIYPQAVANMGFVLKAIGDSSTTDAEKYRILGYLGFANFADLGLARIRNVNLAAT